MITTDGKLPEAKLVYDFKYKIRYYNLPCAFDIETTNINDDAHNRMAFPYHMQLMIGNTFITCRTIDELGQVFTSIQQNYGLGENHSVKSTKYSLMNLGLKCVIAALFPA